MTTARRRNRALILNLLREQGSLSRADLSSLTGLAPSAISSLTEELAALGLIEESSTLSGGGPGRPAQGLALSERGPRVISVDIGVDRWACGLVAVNGNVFEAGYHPYVEREPAKILQEIVSVVQRVASQEMERGYPPIAIGVSMVGLVDPVDGKSRFAPNLNWREIPIRSYFEEHLSLPVLVENNVRALALAEHLFGVGVGKEGLLLVQVGPGIGCGIVVHRDLYQGAGFSAGELGHCTVVVDGPVCSCGKRGCLEVVASEKALLRDLRAKGWSGGPGLGMHEQQAAGMSSVVEALEAEDPLVTGEVMRNARLLGMGVATAVNLLDPPAVVITGGLLTSQKKWRQWLYESVVEHCFVSPQDLPPILDSKLGDHRSLKGAGSLALRRHIYSASELLTAASKAY